MYYTQKIVPKFYQLTKQISQFKCKPSCVINSILITKECNAKSLSLSLSLNIYIYICMYVCMYVCMYWTRQLGGKRPKPMGEIMMSMTHLEREREMRACTLGTLCSKYHMEELFWLDSKGARPPHLCTLSLS